MKKHKRYRESAKKIVKLRKKNLFPSNLKENDKQACFLEQEKILENIMKKWKERLILNDFEKDCTKFVKYTFQLNKSPRNNLMQAESYDQSASCITQP